MDAHALALQALNWLASQPAWLALAFVAFIAFIEYPIPPIPHDVVVVAGGVLAAHHAMNPVALITVVTIFSALGAVAAAKIGGLAGTHPGLRRFMMRFTSEESLAKTAERFRKYGRLILAANRFLPGAKTALIFSAGLFRMRAVDVAVFCGVSAFLWNGLLIGLGLWVGKNLDEVIDWVERYSLIAWSLVAAVIVFFVARALIKRRRQRAGPSHASLSQASSSQASSQPHPRPAP